MVHVRSFDLFSFALGSLWALCNFYLSWLEGLGFRAVVEWESSQGLQFGRLTISVTNAVASLQVIAQTMCKGICLCVT